MEEEEEEKEEEEYPTDGIPAISTHFILYIQTSMQKVFSLAHIPLTRKLLLMQPTCVVGCYCTM